MTGMIYTRITTTTARRTQRVTNGINAKIHKRKWKVQICAVKVIKVWKHEQNRTEKRNINWSGHTNSANAADVKVMADELFPFKFLVQDRWQQYAYHTNWPLKWDTAVAVPTEKAMDVVDGKWTNSVRRI